METNNTFSEGRVACAQLTNLFETEELEQRLELVSAWDDYYDEWEPVKQ